VFLPLVLFFGVFVVVGVVVKGGREGGREGVCAYMIETEMNKPK